MAFTLDDTQPVKPRIAGLFLMPLRWVVAWILFSAAWRRLVLKPEALDPNSPLYEGVKLVHFLPQTAWVKYFLHYIVIHPTVMLIFLWCFTLVEITTGIMLFLGVVTRLWGLVLIVLFSCLMMVSGALGSTCLDEWTVASMGIGFGVCLLLAGSGPYSIDSVIFSKFNHLVEHRFWGIFISPELSFIHHYSVGKRYALVLSCLTLFFVLATNQYFVGGLYGPFYNPAIHMNVLLHAQLQPNGALTLTLHRDQGPDTYGDFIIDILVNNPEGKTILHYDQKQLSQRSNQQIHNKFIVKAGSNAHALVLPLGSLATIDFTPPNAMQLKPGSYEVTITDISGQSWHTMATVNDIPQPFDFDPYNLVHQ